MQIIKGKRPKPMKVLIYGVEGVGKSTLAAQFPEPLIVDLEDRTSHIDCDRVIAETYQDVLDVVKDITQHGYKTIVIDTVDWLEHKISDHICTMHGKSQIEAFGYGKGYKMVAEEGRRFLGMLQEIQKTHALHIVLLGHSKITRFDDPALESAYDRYQLKCSDSFSAACKEWCDNVFFCNYYVALKKDEGTKKAKGTGGQRRVLYTRHCAAYDAKTSIELPDELPMEFDALAPFVNECEPDPRMKDAGEVKALKRQALDSVKAKGFDVNWLKDLLNGRVFDDFTLDEALQFMDELYEELKQEDIPN